GTAWTLDTVAPNAGYTNTFNTTLKSAIAYANGTAYIAYEEYNEPYTDSHRIQFAVGGPGTWQLSGLPLPSSALETVSPVMRRDAGGSLHLAFLQRVADAFGNLYEQIIYGGQDPAPPAWLTRT